ncbi:MAG TPA: hypothetical protein VK053_20930 [Jiangellaceae bacterium]|nr:hypothetical protein [Jiangellaceae bacterium]
MTCEDDGDVDEPEEDVCVQGEPVVAEAPCEFFGRTYYQPLDAWVEDVTEAFIDQPDHPYWEGNHPAGVIVRVYKLTGLGGEGTQNPRWEQRYPRWIAELPGSGEPEVDPEELAEEVLDEMDLQPIEAATAPPPDGVGLIGLPVWLWADDPSPRTWGPITDTGSAGGVSVTVTAEVDRAEWSMGDGTTVTCTTPGTPFQPGQEANDSPDCGHTYDTPDTYPIAVTTYWVADWESDEGDTGTLEVDFDASTELSVAEARSTLVD